MAKQYLTSEEEVKQCLKIESFRNMSKEKIMEFVTLMPKIDKEITLSIINQFPAYSEYSLNMVEQLNIMCNNILQSNNASQKETIDAYKTALNSITEQFKQENITPELRMQLNNKMIEIADKISEKDTENKNWLKHILSSFLPIISGFFFIVIGIFTSGRPKK